MNAELYLRALRTNVDMLEDLITSIPRESLNIERGPGIWSIRKHIEHLALVQEVLFKRLELFMTNEHPIIVPHDPAAETEIHDRDERTADELLETFKTWRKKQIDLIEGCDLEIRRRKADHPEYITYDFAILVRHIVLHDGFHLNRIEDIGFLKDGALNP